MRRIRVGKHAAADPTGVPSFGASALAAIAVKILRQLRCRDKLPCVQPKRFNNRAQNNKMAIALTCNHLWLYRSAAIPLAARQMTETYDQCRPQALRHRPLERGRNCNVLRELLTHFTFGGQVVWFRKYFRQKILTQTIEAAESRITQIYPSSRTDWLIGLQTDGQDEKPASRQGRMVGTEPISISCRYKSMVRSVLPRTGSPLSRN